MKITPAHDHDDYETGQRHGLPMITVLDDDATITDTGDALRRAWTATTPASAIVADLERARRPRRRDSRTRWSSGAASAATTSSSRASRRSGSSGPSRWPRAALDATRTGRTRIVPARFEKTWEHWLTNIRDWNVSRQLWWGHRIPAWYCPDGHVTVSSSRTGRTRARSAAGRRPSSSRTPTSSTRGSAPGCGRSRRSAGRTTTPDLARFYPTSVMETGYDIIFFWVARMMMLGIH